MSKEKTNQELIVETPESGWNGLYRIAGVGSVIAVGFVLLDIGLSFAGGDAGVGDLSAVDWFAALQSNWFLGVRNLGLFNVINTTLTLPLYLALYQVHRRVSPAYAALALILFLFGAAIYDANNRALSMLALSDQYAAASTEAQRSLLAAAGTVILAQAEDFTPGSFIGFFFSNLASIVMMFVMLRSRIFSKWIALMGLTGSVFLFFFTISATFVPAIFDLAMLFALVGGLLMLAWNIRMALAMFRMGQVSMNQTAAKPISTKLVPTEPDQA